MKRLILILLLCSPAWAFSQSYMEHLYVNNVQWWGIDNGSIDTLLIEVRPQGIYTEIGLTFNFSTRGTYYGNGDSLEVEMMFKLPDDAEVTDMWLWINDSIIVADIYDKWTASQVYEDIVDRRTDPSILYKYEGYDWWSGTFIEGYYMWKIFPMLNTLPRKAKFTYMVRSSDYMGRNPFVDLPVNLMQLSFLDIQKIKLQFYPASGMSAPKIEQAPGISFNHHPAGIDPEYYEADITSVDYYQPITFSYRHAMISPAWATWTDTNNNENFFQLQVIPDELFGFRAKKKALILFDFVASNCNAYTGTSLLAEIKNQLGRQLEDIDSVCFMFSGPVTQMYGSGWIPADSISLAAAFSTMNNGWFNAYSNLTTLLVDGINFIKSHENEGSIILISSDKSHGDPVTANTLLTNILNIIDTNEITINIVDLNTTSSPYYYIGQQYFYGNAYLYMILSAQTTGDLYDLKNSNGETIFNDVFSKLCGYFTNFSIYIFPQGGYTYSNYVLSASGGLNYYDQTVQIIGKYHGSMPFHLMAFAEKDGVMLSYEGDIILGTQYDADYTTRKIWAAQYLRELTGLTPNNSLVSQIIGTSINERVLSDYTAFLALEPGVGPFENPEGQPTSVKDTETDKPGLQDLKLYPNPTSADIQLNFNIANDGHLRIELLDLTGRSLLLITDSDYSAGDQHFKADLSKLSSGTYFIRIQQEDQKSVYLKVVKI